MKTKYEEIVNTANIATKTTADIKDVILLAEGEQLTPAFADAKKVLLLCIDMQNDFMEGGSLEVLGSKGDVERLTKFMYTNMTKISQVMCSLDTHSTAQIFHQCWWEDEKGKQPAPYTIITYNDVSNGKWQPVYGEPAKSLDYLKHLESDGKKQLCIWPYHCLAGTNGAQLENEFVKMVYFQSVARKSKPAFISKGTNPFTEMYGIIKAEYDPKNFLNTPVLNAIKTFDEIYVAGEASSHCVLESMKQILEYYSGEPDVTQRITFLEDCTSPIPGFEKSTTDTFETFKQQYGIRIAKSVDIIL